ncbi:ArsR/SmtB family transcription factor [Mycoplasma todarodis]|uniref:HTH arsR-type domain-containing protein n=1 Tax=Mycoplasma todarodis TaxID=1937191 RepID=A0A4R0XR84_9MOLU|nr:ArsR family transcriptional regulator [Mycoplasma todarodis]TCG12120.1 hypothetical protein C4B25_00295 [Mycoplasma todarodis]
MEITKFMKVFSVEMRIKFLAHFYTCKCKDHTVTDLVAKFGTSQANISKHLLLMEDLGILSYTCEKKVKYYWLNEDFKKEWEHLIKPIISNEKLKEFYCCCSQSTNI